MNIGMILKKIDIENDCQIHVVKISKGYSVGVFDTEAEKYAPVAKIYNTLEEALKYAEQSSPSKSKG